MSSKTVKVAKMESVGQGKNLYEKQNVSSVGQLEGLWTRTTVIK